MEPVNLHEFEALAKAKLPAMAYDYYSSGACDEITLHRNQSAYREIFLKYRVLVDVSNRDLSTTVLGQKISFPVMIAPTAFKQITHPECENATARAASAEDTIIILNTLSNSPVEDVSKAANGNLWFQLYVYKDRGVTRELIQRVEKAGCRAIVVTVDAPFLGIREKDVRNNFTLPEGLTIKNMTSSWLAEVTAAIGKSGLQGYFASQLDSTLSWKDIEWLRSITKLPVILKGIACKEDAILAAQHNIDAIVISNHGGRQLDTCRASIEVLPEVMECPVGKMEILIDGGIR